MASGWLFAAPPFKAACTLAIWSERKFRRAAFRAVDGGRQGSTGRMDAGQSVAYFRL